VQTIEQQWCRNGKRTIEARLQRSGDSPRNEPVFRGGNLRYEVSDRVGAIGCGGIGAVHLLAQRIGLIDAIDQHLHVLKLHKPYHESDHVLNIAYNILCGGRRLEDIERRRNDTVFLDALQTDRIPDPTTAGDFCRRLQPEHVLALGDAFDEVRLRVWQQQPQEFLEQATIDMDGTLVGTTGSCKQGMDIAYDGTWGYHPLVLTLAETGEVLCVLNRSGNRPSHEGAAEAAGDAMALCFRAGFRRVRLRGDTDFTQTRHLDAWTEDPRVQFVFGIDAMPQLTAIGEELAATAWKRLFRRVKRAPATTPRQRPANVKEPIVAEREFENIRLKHEDIAECRYRPHACRKEYRLVIVRKNLSIERGETALFDDVRYHFYLTNDWESPAEAIVFQANDRCQQENVIEQLKNGARALLAPVDNLVSNWAYMVMAALAWNLKAWWALHLPVTPGRWSARRRDEKEQVLRMEFRKFVSYFIEMPCQILRSGRRLIYRLLSWNPWQHVFFRLYERLRC